MTEYTKIQLERIQSMFPEAFSVTLEDEEHVSVLFQTPVDVEYILDQLAEEDYDEVEVRHNRRFIISIS